MTMVSAFKSVSGQTGLTALAVAALATALTMPQARAANIITFDNTAQSCGAAVLCSTSGGPLPAGTQGYVQSGAIPFDLSTITEWFQIDPDGISHLPNQPAEPDGGAGGFLVINDTGSTVTSLSITLTDTFTSSTPSVTFCSGGSGPLCDNFQANKGNAAPAGAFEALSGPDFSAARTDPRWAYTRVRALPDKLRQTSNRIW